MKRPSSGLGGPTPEMVAQAQNETSATIVKITLAFVGAASFCLLSLLAPDSSLLNGVTLNVPFAGPVSFLGFMIIGPFVLIVLRIYLQIYVELMRRLDPIGRRLHPLRVPTLDIRRNALLRVFIGFVVYLLLPLTMLAFTWKAAVLVGWIPGLVGATTAVIMSHVILALRWPWRSKIPQRLKILLGLGAVIIPAGAILAILLRFGAESLQRPYDLLNSDLSKQWLRGANLVGADLRGARLTGDNLLEVDISAANLTGADLSAANLTGADLSGANLTRTDLSRAKLPGANLSGADLSGANLSGADLSGANLTRADLSAAKLPGANLSGTDLSGVDLKGACGDALTKAPAGVLISQCP